MSTRSVRRPRRPANAEPDAAFEDDNDGTEERPSRRATSRPARRSAPAARRDDDDEPRGRGRGSSKADDDDGDEAAAGVVGSGWGTWRQKKAEASDFADEFKVSEYKTKYHVLFLDNKPFATYNEHWIDEMPKGKKKSYICIGKSNGCPLCKALGEKPSPRACFNVVEFVENEPVLKVWVAGSGIVQSIEDNVDDPGLEGNYFNVSKTKSGKNGPTQYNVNPVKARDLPEDWDMDPLTDDEIEALDGEKYDEKYLKVPTKKALQDIADEVMSWD